MAHVSVIVPCYNEQDTIGLLLEALVHQTYPRQDLEVIIADGMSTDETRRKVHRFAQDHTDLAIRIVDNPKRHIPAALNQALADARGEFIVRLDAHSVPAKDYISRCMEHLEAGVADNVGGVWEIVPGRSSWQGRSIAAAAAHPLGAGDAYYRLLTRPRFVETVPFGSFRKSLLERMGGFDETLLSNEDYELNSRLLKAGGKIYLDPQIRSVYFARPDFASLARQYLRYGYWKGQMLRRFPETLRWRQAVPPLFVLLLLTLILVGLWFAWGRLGLALFLAFYGGVLLIAGIRAGLKKRDVGLVLGMPLAFFVMHICWGGALLGSILRKG